MISHRHLSRRQFVRQSAAAASGLALPYFVPPCVLAAQPDDSVSGSPSDRSIHVLSVTGLDSKAHNWKERSAAISTLLKKDKRFQVVVTEDPQSLADLDLKGFDVLFFHFRNLEPFDRAEQFQNKLIEFVRNGGGLVLLHGASGAFPYWPEYQKLAGRIWGKKVGHDPRGPFEVKIADDNHPVTQKMKDFQADDELYCYLVGEQPIKVLASAQSRLTGEVVPIAFAMDYGKGRVFHCSLGHDAKAVLMPGTAELLRRGCAWAGG